MIGRVLALGTLTGLLLLLAAGTDHPAAADPRPTAARAPAPGPQRPLLRRLPVHPRPLAVRRRHRPAQPGHPHRTGLPRPLPVPDARLATLDLRRHPRPHT